jgi:(p)ppGpp synthase/HD superfamily hydrolase
MNDTTYILDEGWEKDDLDGYLELESNNSTIVIDAINYALAKHNGQLYGNLPYREHLKEVSFTARFYGFYSEPIIASCWLHDIIEDTDSNFEELYNIFGVEIANIVVSVTDEPGKTRSERKAISYLKISNNLDALIVKLCDRIANISKCIDDNNSDLFKMYKNEHNLFYKKLYSPNQDIHILKLWEAISNLLEINA